jgi:charged multivesicular body protein 4A/B
MVFGRKKKAPPPKASVQKLRETVDLLDKRAAYIQKKMDAEVAQAKDHMAKKNKRAALACLKRKKTYEAQLEKVWAQRHTVETQMMTLEDSVATVDTLSAMKTGSAAMKSIHKKTKIDDVDNLMDDIADQQDQADEISQALTQSIGGEFIDEDDLEAELGDLMDEAAQEELMGLDSAPSVASHDLPAKQKASTTIGMDSFHVLPSLNRSSFFSLPPSLPPFPHLACGRGGVSEMFRFSSPPRPPSFCFVVLSLFGRLADTLFICRRRGGARRAHGFHVKLLFSW